MTKLEKIQRFLNHYWGFTLTKNSPKNHGYWAGCCKSGYTVNGSLRGSFCRRHDSIAEVIRIYDLDKMKPKEIEIALKYPIENGKIQYPKLDSSIPDEGRGWAIYKPSKD